MDGVVIISKSPSVVVTPAAPATATDDISLSCYDMWFVSTADTVFLVFENAIQEPFETIKRGLSQALVHYYPMAGRFASGATTDQVVIRCTGEGVPLVAASANCALKDVQPLSDPSLQQELAIFYPAESSSGGSGSGSGRYSEADPFVLMQVTVFSCGGFVLGVTWSHGVADGVGMGKFLQAVAELARGLPSPSIVPVRRDDSVMLHLPTFSTNFFQCMGRIQPSSSQMMRELDITLKPSLINRIKDKYASMNSGRRCSVFEAAAAVLWRCRTRAIGAGPKDLAVLTFSADLRKHLGAKEGYYGNCLTARLVTASSGAVGNGDVMDIVKAVQRAKDGSAPQVSDFNDLLQPDGYNILGVTCWRNIGFEAPDFGSGTPGRVKCLGKERTQPFCVACIPNKDDEYNMLSRCVKEDHAAAFLHELAHMHLNYN